jgi:proteic killer suppression protein
VWIAKFAEKQMRRLPSHIVEAFWAWARSVELDGIYKTRAIPGYHDEALSGDRKGQRSVRLSKAYRVIYEETESGNIVLICVLEMNKHEY